MPMDKKTALQQVSSSLGIPSDWLDKLIQFESGWTPKIANKYSSAKGLIQFIDSTAKNLGYTNSQDLIDKNPDVITQLKGPVYQYLNSLKPFPTEQSLYMSVFYPAARNWPIDTAFPDTIRSVNPGINTVADYVARVKRSPIIRTATSISGIAVLLLASFLSYQFLIKPYIQRKAALWTPKSQIEVVEPEMIPDEETE